MLQSRKCVLGIAIRDRDPGAAESLGFAKMKVRYQ